MLSKLLILASLIVGLAASVSANSCVAQATGNWSSAGTWTSCGGSVPGNGDTAAISGYSVTVDANTTVGASGGTGTTAIDMSTSGSTLTIATNITLTVRGNILRGTSSFTLDCGSELYFDSSVSSVAYKMASGTSTGQTISLSTGGSCSANPWTITGTAAYPFAITEATSQQALSPTLSYGTISNCGSSSYDCFDSYTGAVSLDHVIFNTTGQFVTGSVPSATTFSVTNSTWKGSLGTYSLSMTGAHLPSGTRVLTGDVFDIRPDIDMDSMTVSNDYFDAGWLDQSVNAPASLTGVFIRQTGSRQPTPISAVWGLANSYVLPDYWPTPTVTSTATSSTGTTLTDSSQSWTTNQFQGVSTDGWMV